MLFAALVSLTVAYSMIFAALHGNWQFWRYWLPGTTPQGTPT